LSVSIEGMRADLKADKPLEASKDLSGLIEGLTAAVKARDVKVAAATTSAWLAPGMDGKKTAAGKIVAVFEGFASKFKNPLDINSIPGVDLTKKLGDNYQVREAYVKLRVGDLAKASELMNNAKTALGETGTDGVVRAKAGVFGAQYLADAGGLRQSATQFSSLSVAGVAVAAMGEQRATNLARTGADGVSRLETLSISATVKDEGEVDRTMSVLRSNAAEGAALGAAADLSRSRYENSRDVGAGVGLLLMPETFKAINAGSDSIVKDVVVRGDNRTVGLSGSMQEGLKAQSDLGWETIKFTAQTALLSVEAVGVARAIVKSAGVAEDAASTLGWGEFRSAAVKWADARLSAQGAGNFLLRWEGSAVKEVATMTGKKALVETAVGALFGVGFMEGGTKLETGHWEGNWKTIGSAAVTGIEWAGIGKLSPPLELLKSPAAALIELKPVQNWLGVTAEKGLFAMSAQGKQRLGCHNGFGDVRRFGNDDGGAIVGPTCRSGGSGRFGGRQVDLGTEASGGGRSVGGVGVRIGENVL
jgi:hypothetical protein